MKTPAQILRDARALIEDPAHWLRNGNYATDAQGRPAAVVSPNAVNFCALGSLDCSALRGRDEIEIDPVLGAAWDRAIFLLYKAFEVLLGKRGSLTGWNDDHATHPELLALFDVAIAAAEAEEAS